MSDGLPSAADLFKNASEHCREYARHARSLPAQDYDYHQAFLGFTRHVEAHSEAMIRVMEASAKQIPRKRRLSLTKSAMTPSQRHTTVMDLVDSLLERVDRCLDEARGQTLDAENQLHIAFPSGSTAPQHGYAAGTAAPTAVVVKPQLSFDSPVDNSPAPFRAKRYDLQRLSAPPVVCEPGVHPYRSLIESFSFPAWELLPEEGTPFLPLDTTPLSYVSSLEELDALVDMLAGEREFAVDLEHHDMHSYQGITCLMQISTRSADYLVDVIALRSHMYRVNRVFLDPTILKVFHGAKEDIRWLQKDFDVYVANLFDTGIALQTLHMPHGLAFAVDHFCQVRLDKTYQMADWRLRPIPSSMIHYARQDTHYLLYCFDRLKSLLLHADSRASVGNLLVHVLNESRRLCLTMYEKPTLDPRESFRDAMGRSLGGLSATQVEVLRQVFNWRDALAREADESPMAIMHTSAVLQIASKLPSTARDILKCCVPVSVVVRREVGQLVSLIASVCGSDGAGTSRDTIGGDSTSGNAGPAAPSQSARASQQRSFIPNSGTLPSVASGLSDDTSYVLEGSATVSVAVATGATIQPPSAWFRALVSQSAAVRQVVTPVIDLPGSQVTARILIKHSNKRVATGTTSSSGGVGTSNDLNGERGAEDQPSVALPTGWVDDADDAEAVERTTGTAPSGTVEAPPQGPKRPQAPEEGFSSIFEAHGSGRAERRKKRGRTNE